MSSNDAHQGGSLEEMAQHGTNIPGDAGLQRTIPSVPRPDQVDADSTAAPNLAMAADNPTDIPRSYKDTGMTGEVVTGIGNQLPATTVEQKNLAGGGNEPLAKGDSRYTKHAQQLESDQDKLASRGAAVDPAPGDEDVDNGELRNRRDGQSKG